jgi:hypothetical protein
LEALQKNLLEAFPHQSLQKQVFVGFEDLNHLPLPYPDKVTKEKSRAAHGGVTLTMSPLGSSAIFSK